MPAKKQPKKHTGKTLAGRLPRPSVYDLPAAPPPQFQGATNRPLNKGRYKPHDKYIVFNDDDADLVPIKYELPEPPPLETIDGYGLEAKEQYFKKPQYSKKLQALMRKGDMLPSEKWKEMEANPDWYADDIKFLLVLWDRIYNGYWFFNNGKPTYITGLNYFFLISWRMRATSSIFRMTDREACLFIKMCSEDPYCAGFNWPKGRRYGATSLVTCWRYYVAMTGKEMHVGIQSKTDDDAYMVHENHMIFAWKKMPFWFSPVYDGKLESKHFIRFFSPDSKSNADYGAEALGSFIDYKNSTEQAYDGDILNALHNDEIGKAKKIDVKKRWAVQRPTLEKNQEFIGMAINTSTVDEMETGGGQEFKNICDQSHYQQKDPITRRTASGLYNFFMPDDEGLLGKDPDTGLSFIDKFGFCNKEIGRRKLLAERKQLRDSGDFVGYIEKVRQHPLEWKECWMKSAENCHFDLENIEFVLDKYRKINSDGGFGEYPYVNPDVRIGNFEWLGGIQDSRVVWRDDKKNGRFVTSWLFDHDSLSNFQVVDHNGIRRPGNTRKFVAGGDTFKYRETVGKKRSNGGGAVYWKLDFTIDGVNTAVDKLRSARFICTYNYRPAKPEDFAEDMLKMCVYYGCEIFPELNVTTIWDWFITRGYAGYLFFRVDAKNHVSIQPGAQMSEKLKEEIFQAMASHIKDNGKRECHPELLQECKDIAGPEYMTDFDLFTAAGCALIGARKSMWNRGYEVPKETFNLEDCYEIFDYSLTG